uniref:Uncharacterized protein n=1 Tax=Sphaerodactylus townsendi TaxID=933632 RepID=A0ACB8EJF5_9SAUR
MPQLNSGGGDDLGANDEMIAFKDEGEQEEKMQANVFTEGDLADLKSSLVNESESTGGSNSQSSNAAAVATAGAHPEAMRRLQDPQRVYREKLPDHMEDDLKHQDPGMYKGPAYSGYPFLMVSDPYLPNGSMSPLVSSCDPKVLLRPANLEVSSVNLTENKFPVKVFGICVFSVQYTDCRKVFTVASFAYTIMHYSEASFISITVKCQ